MRPYTIQPMKTCEYDGAPFTEARSHPWTDAVSNDAFRYYDLRADPSLVRTALEDFVPYGHYPAIEDFYALVEWLNGRDGVLESNDCAFDGPAETDDGYACSGRLMVLYRTLEKNVAKGGVERLKDGLHHALAPLGPDFEQGVVGTTLVPVRFLALPPRAQLGQQLMLSFWAFGDSEADVMANLQRVVSYLSQALRRVSAVSLSGGGGSPARGRRGRAR